MPPQSAIAKIIYKKRFESDLKKLQPDVVAAAKKAMADLYKSPLPASLRFHKLSGYRNPKVFTVDVFTNHSYKISLEINGNVATLRRVATHKEIDSCP